MVLIEQYARLTEDYQLLDIPFGPKIAGIRYVHVLLSKEYLPWATAMKLQRKAGAES